MKKLALVLSVVVMVMSSVVTALAKPSVDVSGVVTIDRAQSSDGKNLVIRFEELTSEQKTLVNELLKPENLKELLGDAYSKNWQVIDSQNVFVWDEKHGKIDYDEAKGLFPVTLTFNVPGVKSNTKVQILHYYDGKWHVANGLEISDGKVKGSFEKLSPLVFLVDNTTTEGGGEGGGSSTITSPQTGENNEIMYIALLTVVAFVGVVILGKKKTA